MAPIPVLLASSLLASSLLACSSPEDDSGSDLATIEWSGAVSLDADFVVASGETLVIAPGTTITAASGVTLVVEGELDALGTLDAPILFTAASTDGTSGDASAWGGIAFTSGAVSATFEGVDVYKSGSIIEHAVLEHATRALHVSGSSPYLHAVTFQSNEIPMTVDTVGGAGLLISDGSTTRVRDCTFEDNVANTFAFGGGVYVDRADPILQDNTLHGNSASYGGGLSTDLMASPIVGSWFDTNDSQSEGGAISLVSTVSALLGNTVFQNTSKTDGAGVHVCVTCYPHASPYLYDNVITDNVSTTADPDEGAAGIGAAFLGGMASNDVHGNLRDGQPSDFSWYNIDSEDWPDWVANPSLSDVWWGTEDADAIGATVYDGVDNPEYATVAIDAARVEPIGGAIPRAIIATRKMQYEDAGDDMPVFLTVYNPGAERVVTLTILQDDVVPDLELAYPDAEVDGGVWTLTLPENSVWFGTIASSTYDGVSVSDVTWSAELLDTAGARIGVPVIARYFTSPAE